MGGGGAGRSMWGTQGPLLSSKVATAGKDAEKAEPKQGLILLWPHSPFPGLPPCLLYGGPSKCCPASVHWQANYGRNRCWSCSRSFIQMFVCVEHRHKYRLTPALTFGHTESCICIFCQHAFLKNWMNEYIQKKRPSHVTLTYILWFMEPISAHTFACIVPNTSILPLRTCQMITTVLYFFKKIILFLFTVTENKELTSVLKQ